MSIGLSRRRYSTASIGKERRENGGVQRVDGP